MRHTSLHLFMNDGDMWDTVSCEGLVSFRGEECMELILWRKTLYKLVRVVFSHSNKWRLCFHIFQMGLLLLWASIMRLVKEPGIWKLMISVHWCPIQWTKISQHPQKFGQKTVIDKMKMKTVAVFLVENYSVCQLCKLELPGNRGSKEGNAEAQSTQLLATWAWPYHPSDGSKLDSVAKSTLCWLLFCNLQPINTSEQGVCILPLTIVIQ